MHCGRVPTSFDESDAEKAEPAADTTASTDGAEPDREPAEAANGDRSDPPGGKPA